MTKALCLHHNVQIMIELVCNGELKTWLLGKVGSWACRYGFNITLEALIKSDKILLSAMW